MNNNVVLGLWPIAGITTVGVTRDAARETIAAAIESGIGQFDTAFGYGYDGESDRVLGEFVASRQDDFRVIGKVGQRWTADRKRISDGSPAQLTADAEESLRRIGIDCFDTLLLHTPDPNTPLTESATALVKLQERGLCKRVGACNISIDQLEQFAQVTKCTATQCSLNILQQDALEETIPAFADHGAEVHIFWALMKGLLAGKITRDHTFPEGDVRPKYEVYQGESREQAHRLLDFMRVLGDQTGKTIPQLSIGWVLSQPGVTGVLAGARYPEQIIETAKSEPLAESVLKQLDDFLESDRTEA